MNAVGYRSIVNRIAVSLAHCLAAVIVVGVTTAILFLASSVVNTASAALVFLAPVGFVAMAWGVVPGILAALMALVALNYFFIPPLHTFGITDTDDWVLALVFFGFVLVGGPLLARARASLEESRARQRELIHLYELITALAGIRRADAVARTVSKRLQEALPARMVEVVFQADARHELVSDRAPGAVAVPPTRPDRVLPLLTPRGLLGEIHVWLAEPRLSSYTEQLLRTSASQAALAFERVMLAEAETRGKVLAESDQMKSMLLSSVSHELRTPLATIKAAVSSLRGGAVPWESPARADLLAAIEEEADQLNLLVGNLLDMSRIEAGALSLQRQWNVLADIVDNALDRLRRAAEKHHLVMDVSEELPLAPVDYAQMVQVFINLIGNSLKYAPAGTSVRISAAAQDGWIEAVVANQGPPVAEGHLERIFDKFHRVTAADRITGTGLGLSICKGIVEAHGGRIWAENLPPGAGGPGLPYTFAFHVALPLSPPGLEQRAVPAEPGADPGAEPEPEGMPGP